MSHSEPSPEPSTEPAAIFRRDGGDLVPSRFAQGPWRPDHLHGGPICGLVARAIESCATPVPMRVVRMTVEMTRAVPMAPLAVHAEVSRAGKRIQRIDASVAAEGRTLVRATALSMRVGTPDGAIALPFDEPIPERAAGAPRTPEMIRLFTPGFIHALDFLRPRAASRTEAGVIWARMRVPLVEGEAPTRSCAWPRCATSRAEPATRSSSRATRRSIPTCRCTCCASRAASGSGCAGTPGSRRTVWVTRPPHCSTARA